MKNFVLGALFCIVMIFGMFAIFENSQIDFALRERLKSSTVLACQSAIGRGARGEAYKTTVYTLCDKTGVKWAYTSRFMEYEQLTCPK